MSIVTSNTTSLTKSAPLKPLTMELPHFGGHNLWNIVTCGSTIMLTNKSLFAKNHVSLQVQIVTYLTNNYHQANCNVKTFVTRHLPICRSVVVDSCELAIISELGFASPVWDSEPSWGCWTNNTCNISSTTIPFSVRVGLAPCFWGRPWEYWTRKHLKTELNSWFTAQDMCVSNDMCTNVYYEYNFVCGFIWK